MMSDRPEQKVDQPAYFGGSEISFDVRRSDVAMDTRVVEPISAEVLSPGESLVNALHEAERFDSRGFYTSGREILTAALAVAYSLSLEIRWGGDTAIQVAVDRLSSKRTRKISAAKIELMALELTAKPQNVSERKLCSSHASILKVARDEGVSKERFADWFRGKKIKDCRRRAARKAQPEAECKKMPDLGRSDWMESEEDPVLRVEIASAEDLLAELTVPLDRLSSVKVSALARLLDSDQAVSSILRNLAELLEPQPKPG